MSGEIEGPTVEWVSIETYTRALQQLAAAEGRAVEWKAGYHEQVRKLARSVADCEIAKIERDAQIARQAEQLAALTKIGNEAAQLHEMTAQYIAVLEPTWLPEDHESRVSARAQVAGHRSRVEQIQAVLAAAEQPAAPSGEGGS